MKKITIYRNKQKPALASAGSVVAIGNFDGLHLGHKKVLLAAKKCAESNNLPLIVITFEPHPVKVFSPSLYKGRLTPFAEKAREMREIGVNGIYVIHFSKNYAQTTPEEFVEQTLIKALNAKHIFVGDDFNFGKGRTGNVESLSEVGKEKGFKVTGVSQYIQGEKRVSSTRIREELEKGNITQIPSLLGRNYSVRTRFIETEMLTLVGFMPNYAPVKNGAYWCEVDYAGGRYTLPVVVTGSKLTIPAIAERPEVVKGAVAEVCFVDVMTLESLPK